MRQKTAVLACLLVLAAACGDSGASTAEPASDADATPATTQPPATTGVTTTTQAPTTEAPAITLAGPEALILGTWDSPWGQFEIKDDGTFVVTEDGATKDAGTYVVSDGQMILTSAGDSPNCAGLEANYFLGVDSPDNIRMLLNSEECDDRKADLDFKPLLRVSG